MSPFTRYFNLTSFIRLKKNYQYKYRRTKVIQNSELYTRSKRQRKENRKSQRFSSIFASNFLYKNVLLLEGSKYVYLVIFNANILYKK